MVHGTMERTSVADVALEAVADGVYLGDLASGRRASMKFWRIEPGATLPAHAHENEQIGYVIEGELSAVGGGEAVTLAAGDAYRFPSGERHGAENRAAEPAVGLGVLAPPREDPDWRER